MPEGTFGVPPGKVIYPVLLRRIVTINSATKADFSGIPPNFWGLQLTYTCRDTTAGTGNSAIYLMVDGDVTAANYSSAQRTGAQGGVAFANLTAPAANLGSFIGGMPNNGNTAGWWACGEINLPDYSNSLSNRIWYYVNTYTTGPLVGSTETGGGRWNFIAPINRLTVNSGGTAFLDGSTFSLYGIP